VTRDRKTIVLSQGIVTGQRACANGSVTLTTGATSGSLSFRFNGKSGPQASGTLTRSLLAAPPAGRGLSVALGVQAGQQVV
jgi:hypothetical protein